MRLVPVVRLLGPVLSYDMVRTARKGRYVLVRCLYATMLAAVPVLSLLQLLGGVDPVLGLAGFLATGVTMLSLAGLSIISSVQLRRARDAIISTYLVALLYLAFSGLSWLLIVPEGWASWP